MRKPSSGTGSGAVAGPAVCVFRSMSIHTVFSNQVGPPVQVAWRYHWVRTDSVDERAVGGTEFGLDYRISAILPTQQPAPSVVAWPD